jgi:cell division protein FtsB
VEPDRRTRRRRLSWATIALLLIIVVGAMIGAGGRTQSSARQAFEARFGVRAETAATFAQADVAFSLSRERALATTELATALDTQAQFVSFLQALDFGPALVLNGQGRVLNVVP